MSDEKILKLTMNRKFAPIYEAMIWSAVENAVLYGDINVSQCSDEAAVYAAVALYQDGENGNHTGATANAAKGCDSAHEFEYGSRHDDSLLEEGESFQARGKHQLAVLLYATWIEHWINRIILFRCIATGTPPDIATALIRSSAINLKFGKIWATLGMPTFDKDLIRRVNRVLESRNSFVHFKWQVSSEDDHSASVREAGEQAREARAAVESLMEVEDRVFWDCRRDALRQFVRDSVEQKMVSWPTSVETSRDPLG